jgi:beta-glucosidase
MKRSPLCGRNFEYFSEDPHLTGNLAAAWIDGLQAQGVGASLKHFAVNNQETRRMSVSAEVDERTLREIYLPAFRTAIEDASPWTVMCAYNRINGTYASEHSELLTDVLRNEWGFEGFVVSDWAAVHDRPKALAAGLDLEMPGPRPRRVRAVIDAVARGAIDEAAVDRAVLRILRVIEKTQRTSNDAPHVDTLAHHALARRIAGEGMVLLKNDGLLPLRPGGRIAVIGHAARNPRIQGGGSSQTTPTLIDDPLEELSKLAGDAEIIYAEGYDADGTGRPDQLEDAVQAARRADVAVVYVGLPLAKESEGGDRTDIDLPEQQVRLVEAVTAVQPRTVVVVFSGSAVACEPWVERTSALLEAWYAGQAAGGAIADILFGIVNPSGRLAETFPVRLEDTPAYLNFPGEGDTVRYGEGIFIGYRWYEARQIPVTFPFGHGLSYTTFAYDKAWASASKTTGKEPFSVTVEITNTGNRAGSEVVQVYIRDVVSSVPRPVKELRGFAKVHLEPGASTVVEVTVGPDALAYWDSRARAWVVEPGRFEVLIGSSSSDIRAVLPFDVVDTGTTVSHLDEMSPLQDWLQDRTTRASTIDLLQELAPVLGETFGEAAASVDALDPHFHSYFGTMPLRGLLEFAAPAGGPDPDGRLAELAGLVNGKGVHAASAADKARSATPPG